MTHYDDDQLARLVRSELRRHEQSIDELTLAKVRLARREALAAAEKQEPWWMLPRQRAAYALSLALAVGFGVIGFQQMAVEEPQSMAEAMQHGLEQEMAASQQMLELYEDIDFFHWLALQEESRTPDHE